MTEKTYIFPRLEGGLIGLPPDLDVEGVFNKDYADSDISDPAVLSRQLNAQYGMSSQAKRESVFYRLNELIAEQDAIHDDHGDALARLAASLGTKLATTQTAQHPSNIQSARIDARQKARLACTAALAAGYKP
ncbi:hypothetical protein [Phyllobacterium zundukense]|uniref:Uncharacterized protein n=1 Tax=Phyllobacterium zundukense TaxID=1867719 RepID=A0ACD4D705_9HYPH|nr:hypothetical protein [Phyllobacterium zundukense]UXN61569.1 hypothetical protein N8E88_16040 [Phyllobacterium zundukense]